MQSAFVDLILFNHLAIRNSLSYSENSGFINRSDKMMANFGHLGSHRTPSHLGSSFPVWVTDMVYFGQQY